MSDEVIVNSVRSENTLVYGRTLNSARVHHYVIDGTRDPKEELTPVEVFLSSVSACCVQWVEQFARDAGVPLTRLIVDIEGSRTSAEPNRFRSVTLSVTAAGPSQPQLEEYVEGFKQRCPLYNTVAKATEVTFSIHADG